jgi:hypothetical protein
VRCGALVPLEVVDIKRVHLVRCHVKVLKRRQIMDRCSSLDEIIKARIMLYMAYLAMQVSNVLEYCWGTHTASFGSFS